jgi:hypothetical protein
VPVGEYEFFSLILILPALVIIGGFALLWMTVMRGFKQAEFRHRERMAMIERGLTPPDQVLGDPALQRADGFKMTLGILMCGLGLALFVLISFAGGAPAAGFGVGGAFVMLGLALVVSALHAKRDAALTQTRPSEAPRLP